MFMIMTNKKSKINNIDNNLFLNLNLDFLLAKPRRVRIKNDGLEFMLSVIKNENGFIGARAYGINNPRPDLKDHFILNSSFENVFKDLELAADPCRRDRELIEYND
jgi:hypothetical protein